MIKKWISISVVIVFLFLGISGCGKPKPKVILIETNVGNIQVEIYPWLAPKNTKNILTLIKDGFYDGKRFHRVVNGQVIQTGAYDRGSKSMDMLDYEIPDEINPVDLNLSQEIIADYQKDGYIFDYSVRSLPLRYGIIAMANRGPNTNQSQFFIVTNPEGIQYLNGKYTAFGQVISGVESMLAIDAVKTDSFDEPLEEMYITKITLLP